MASKKMTVRDAYAKAKKSEKPKGGTLYKGSKGIQRARAESKSQNPSSRNKVGAKPKSGNKPGPWDDIARGVVKGAKIADRVVKELGKPAYNPAGAAVDAVKSVAKDVKNKNVAGVLLSAASAVPMGKAGKTAQAISKAATGAKTTKTVADAAKKGGKAASAGKAATTAKKSASAKSTLKQAQEDLASVNRQMQAFKGPKSNGQQASSGWAKLLKQRDIAQRKVNTALQAEQKAGKTAENMKTIGKPEPKRVDLSEGQTITKNKGIQAPDKPRAYSKVGRTERDRGGNAPLEKNQRYAYEADEMKRVEGKERFERREQRRMEKSVKNKERQSVREERTKLNRNQEKYDLIKQRAENGGPRAQQRLERFKTWAKEAGVWGSIKK